MDQPKIVSYAPRHFDGVKALWREAFPDPKAWNEPEFAIPAKLAMQPELFMIAIEGEEVIGSVMAGYDGHRGWLYAVAVRESHRRRGIGSALIQEAERRLQALGCGKINLQIQPANVSVEEFYRRLGYGVENRISMDKLVGRFGQGAA